MGATAIRTGGGLLGYYVSSPLSGVMSPLLAYPFLLAIFFFGLLVVTATPFSTVLVRAKVIALWLWSKKPQRAEEEFEITDTPPFETPVVAWHEDEPEEEIDEGEFDQEFTVEVPKPLDAQLKDAPKSNHHPEQLLLTGDSKYELPSQDLLKVGPASKGKSKANDTVVAALTEVFKQFDIDAQVTGFIDRLPDHAEIAIGGKAIPGAGYFHEATVLTGLQQDDEHIQREIFGPVITVQKFKDDAQAMLWANDVKYGLASSVWTTNHTRALRFAKGLNFGCVWINTHIPLTAEMPHGGFRHSGYGKDLSMYGFEDYTRIKHVMSYIGD
jgi:hypothetical protein